MIQSPCRSKYVLIMAFSDEWKGFLMHRIAWYLFPGLHLINDLSSRVACSADAWIHVESRILDSM